MKLGKDGTRYVRGLTAAEKSLKKETARHIKAAAALIDLHAKMQAGEWGAAEAKKLRKLIESPD